MYTWLDLKITTYPSGSGFPFSYLILMFSLRLSFRSLTGFYSSIVPAVCVDIDFFSLGKKNVRSD